MDFKSTGGKNCFENQSTSSAFFLRNIFSQQLTSVLDRVAGVMKKASTLKISAKLWKLTTLQTIKENSARWTSVFAMTIWFFCIQKELSSIQDLFPLLPTHMEVDLLEKAHIHLKGFHQVNMMLQKEAVSLKC